MILGTKCTLPLLVSLMTTILSLNANGLRNQNKIDSFFAATHTKNLCLQETRWDQAVCEGEMAWRNVLRLRNFVAILFAENIVSDIICVHAPNKEAERKNLFKSLIKWCNANCVTTGDFNVYLSEKDVSSNNVYRRDISRSAIFDLMASRNMVDAWRIL